MTALLDSTLNSDVTERRNCGRQKVLFSSVVISENNCGRVLNISPNGLALQTDTDVVGDDFPNIRFKFSPSLAWFEARGRVAWRNGSTNVLGIEFIGLTEEVQKQIRSWMDLKQESAKLLKPAVTSPTESITQMDLALTVDADAITANASPIPSSDLADLGVEKKSELPALPSGQPTSIVDETRVPAENTNLGSGRSGLGATTKIVGVALVAVVLLSVFFFRGSRARKSTDSKNSIEPGAATGSLAAPTQPVPSVSSATLPSVPTSSPAHSTPSSSVRSSTHRQSPQGPAYVLQVAAMLHEDNANGLATALRKMNFPAFVMKLPTERFHHVLVGPFNSAKAATETQNALESHGYKTIRTEWKVPSP
jgi:cell division septation protein DedD